MFIRHRCVGCLDDFCTVELCIVHNLISIPHGRWQFSTCVSGSGGGRLHTNTQTLSCIHCLPIRVSTRVYISNVFPSGGHEERNYDYIIIELLSGHSTVADVDVHKYFFILCVQWMRTGLTILPQSKKKEERCIDWIQSSGIADSGWSRSPLNIRPGTIFTQPPLCFSVNGDVHHRIECSPEARRLAAVLATYSIFLWLVHR